MKYSVIIFPGSNCDRDVVVALEKFNFKNKIVWHDETLLPESDLVVLPGGFSYGDYLRTGCIASKSRIINSVIEYCVLYNFPIILEFVTYLVSNLENPNIKPDKNKLSIKSITINKPI